MLRRMITETTSQTPKSNMLTTSSGPVLNSKRSTSIIPNSAQKRLLNDLQILRQKEKSLLFDLNLKKRRNVYLPKEIFFGQGRRVLRNVSVGSVNAGDAQSETGPKRAQDDEKHEGDFRNGNKRDLNGSQARMELEERERVDAIAENGDAVHVKRNSNQRLACRRRNGTVESDETKNEIGGEETQENDVDDLLLPMSEVFRKRYVGPVQLNSLSDFVHDEGDEEDEDGPVEWRQRRAVEIFRIVYDAKEEQKEECNKR